MNETALKAEWNLSPSQIIDLKALMGDASDNIPGVNGIGEKGAFKLLAEYPTIDLIYSNLDKITGSVGKKLAQDKDMCYLSYKLATINTHSNLKDKNTVFSYPFPWDNGVFEAFTKLEFRSLLKRAELFSGNSPLKTQQKSETIILNLDSLKKLIKPDFFTNSISIIIENDRFDFCVNEKTNYTLDMLGFTAEMVLPYFTNELSNQSATLYTCNLKNLYHIANRAKIDIRCKCLDVALGMYLLNSNYHDNSAQKMFEHWGLDTTNFATSAFISWKLVYNDLKAKKLDKLYFDIELPLVKVLWKMENAGVFVDTDVLNELTPKYKAEIASLQAKIYDLAGMEFNVNSPKQLAEVLFDHLHMPPNSKKRSTAVDVLEGLRDFHPIIDAILRYRTVTKLYSTYIEGMRPYIRSDGKIHTIFNQTMAVTGRLSSLEPNLQNIPVRTPEGKELRKMIVASPDCVLLSADYSQIELRLLAHYSEDDALIEAFKRGEDIHAVTASQIFGVPLEEVTDSQRRSAKAVNFGIIYGISPFGLANDLKIPQSVAKDYIAKYFMTYPTIKTFLDSSVEKYKHDGYVSTMFGRIRNFDDMISSTQNAGFLARAAMNMPLQGTASDIIKLAMLNIDRKLTENKLNTKMVLQIHDELIFDVPKVELAKVRELVRSEMENVVSLLVPLKVDIEVGPNWCDLK